MTADKTITMQSGALVDGLIQKLFKIINQNLQGNETEYPHASRLLTMLSVEPRRPVPSKPKKLPVVRFWNLVLESLHNSEMAELGHLLQQLTPLLHWWQRENFTSTNMGEDFINNYALAELVGTQGLFRSNIISLGILLMGPDTYYPPHNHPAEECLYVFSGRGTWYLNRGPTISLPPGGMVYIPAGSSHAFWSFEAPMAAIYFCHGDVGQNGWLCEPSDKTRQPS